MPAKAVILAAGMGTRLCPLTPFIPKEMLPVDGFPVIHHVLSELVSVGVKEVAVVLSKGKRSVREYLTARTSPKGEAARRLAEERERVLSALRITFLDQKRLLGTAHAIGLAREFAEGGPLLAVYPDDLLEVRGRPTCGCARDMIALSEATGNSVLLAAEVDGSKASQYGVLDVFSEKDRDVVTAIREKPRDYTKPTALVMIGRMVLTPHALRRISKHRFTDQEGIVPTLAEEASEGHLLAVVHHGARYDVGSHEGYMSLLRDSLKEKNKEALYGERTLPNLSSQDRGT